MNRRFQFSLRALLGIMLVTPPAAYWLLRSRQASQAAHDYLAAVACYDMGTATFHQAYDLSRRLRDAEFAVPFAERRPILVAYLNRIALLERREDGLLHFATLGSGITIVELKARIAALAAEREALEHELGVKAKPAQ